jgi:putative oxidoreductase
MCTHPKMKSWGLLALRLAIGFIFMYMGYSKLGPNHEGAAAMFNSIGFPGGGSLGAYFVGFFEMLGGAMVILGVFASYAAVWLSVIMLVAMATVHKGGPLMGYFLPLAVLGGTLAIAGAGAGRYRLVKTQCHCKGCRGDMKDGGGCCGGNCGGSCGPEEKK